MNKIVKKKKKKIFVNGQTYSVRTLRCGSVRIQGMDMIVPLKEKLPDGCDSIWACSGGETPSILLTENIRQRKKLEIPYKHKISAESLDNTVRYSVMALDQQQKIAYSFYSPSKSKWNAYVHLKNMLDMMPVKGQIQGEDAESILYMSEIEEALKVVVLPAYDTYKDFLEGKVESVQLSRGRFCMHITLEDHGLKITRIYMELRNALTPVQYDFQWYAQKKKDQWVIDADIDLSKLTLAQFYWDIKAEGEKDGIRRSVALTNRERWMHRFLYLRQLHYNYPDGNIVYPYKTKSNTMAFQFRPRTKQDSGLFILKEYLALVIGTLFKKQLRQKNIWIVYEKYCVMAQDNGFYFFKYCMEHLPEEERKHIYYVIDKKAPDYQYVKPYEGQVLQFLSLKHMVYLMAAKIWISSDTKAHAYAWHSPDSVYRNMLKRKKNVFLQHGVIAFKCCHKGLRKRSVNGSNLFVVSSDDEKKILQDYFEYNEDEILVTGLARWDVVEDKSKDVPLQIVLMPTWRTWLEEVSEEEFRKSEYYQHYMQLLNHPTLIRTLEKYQIQLNFYIHPKFREYIGAFKAESSWIRLIEFGSEPLNELMMNCSMMITDYSSAVWDVFYQGKPVLFYLFDLDLYNQVQGSYIDMAKDTFGDTAYTPEELAGLIETYAENGFREKPEYAQMRSHMIKYIDHHNCERIYDEIKKRLPKI